MTKRVLVTGSAGFVGRHLVRRLERTGWEVTQVDLRRPFMERQDCRDYFRKSDTKFDLAVHCAAVIGGRATIDGQPLKVAVDLALDAEFFQWAMRTRPGRVVYLSSSAVYPVKLQQESRLGIVPLKESWLSLDDVEQPDAIYGWVKLTGEMLARHAFREGLDVRVYRPFSGYGSDQNLDYPFPAILERAHRREDPIRVWGRTDSTRDWLHVDDLVGLILRGLELDQWPGLGPEIPPVVNLGTGRATSFGDLALTMATLVGYEPVVVGQEDQPRGVMHRVADVTRMERALGVTGQDLITLEEGIDRCLYRSSRR